MSDQRLSLQRNSDLSSKSANDQNFIPPNEDPPELQIEKSPLDAFREILAASFADIEFKEALLFDDFLVCDEDGGSSGGHDDGGGVSGGGVVGNCGGGGYKGGSNGGGEYRVSVAESLWNGKPCFIVESSSNGVSDDVRWKSQLNATVEIPSLGTVRQKRVFTTESCVEEGDSAEEPLDVECLTTVEMLKRPFTPVEEPRRSADVGIEGEGEDEDQPPKMGGEDEDEAEAVEPPMHVTYRVTNTLKHHDDKEESEMVLSEDDSALFFPEGALVILLRCLVRLTDENPLIPLELKDIDPEFQLCPLNCSRDDSFGRENEFEDVETNPVFRFRLEQHRSDGLVYKIETDHLKTGRLFRRLQEKPFAIFCLRREETVDDDKVSRSQIVPERPEFPKKDLVMEEDLELNSKYQDRKDELKASHASYVREHPELKTLVADFMQEVLTMRPEPFLPFAARYFAAFRQAEVPSRRTSRSSRKAGSAAAAATATVVSVYASNVCVCEEPEPVWEVPSELETTRPCPLLT